ncbi:MAG: HAMP domain-containing sensor histidine kinase [Pseudomonadota bacterium]|nr:HAMP domain-containing sensor histidine kinase [Pseudomonadota bacterium]
MSGIDSNRLKNKKEDILCLWEERCLKEVPSAGTGATLALRDSVPTYLDHLSEALSTNRRMDFKTVVAHNGEATRIGKMHGTDRASNRSYILTEVIFEYSILRQVIFQILEKDGPLNETQRNIIYDSLEQAVNDAAVEFSEIHADIQQKFINTLTHDLKTPIAAAKMSAELILRRVGAVDSNVISIKRIIVGINRLESMIHNLLDASRVRAGERLTLQFIQCDLDAVVREIIDEMSVVHGDRFRLDSKVPIEGNWGCDGLRRALENLIGNAVKYGTSDTIIEVSLKPKETGIEIGVHNQGSLIPEKEIPLLFRQFRRGKSVEDAKQPGWGLGLTLVKGVVDAHKGKIRVESAEGKGTTFILEIPFAETVATASVEPLAT